MARCWQRKPVSTWFMTCCHDMVHGGQGALIPAYHMALSANLPDGFETPAVFVNIGGISNLTYIGEGGRLAAFDSGPGNMLIDQWIEAHTARPSTRAAGRRREAAWSLRWWRTIWKARSSRPISAVRWIAAIFRRRKWVRFRLRTARGRCACDRGGNPQIARYLRKRRRPMWSVVAGG